MIACPRVGSHLSCQSNTTLTCGIYLQQQFVFSLQPPSVYLILIVQLQQSAQLLKFFLSPRMMSPAFETQLTLLNRTRTENAHSSPSYSFHILWHETRQLHNDTIVRQTVDSGWTLCTAGLWKNWAVASLFFFSIETSDMMAEMDVARHH